MARKEHRRGSDRNRSEWGIDSPAAVVCSSVAAALIRNGAYAATAIGKASGASSAFRRGWIARWRTA